MTLRCRIAALLVPVFGLLIRLAGANDEVSFSRDVLPVLTRAGCNSGVCHGSFQGRGGLKLSLLGYDPIADHESLFLAARGRRVNQPSPQESLLVRKAAGLVPHGGGQRLTRDSTGLATLTRYIAEGLKRPTADEPVVAALKVTPREFVLRPGESASLSVTAVWSDGQEQDVTQLALFDSRDRMTVEISPRGEVRILKPGKTAVTARFGGQVASVSVAIPFGESQKLDDFQPVNFIDRLALAEWQRLGVTPAGPASDAEFLRRVFLDLTGVLPTPDEARQFFADPDPGRRDAIIEMLLNRPEFVDLWSLRWSDLLRVHRRYLGDKGLASFRGWVRQSVRENKPLDRMARELLTAQGNLFSSGPVGYFFVDEKPVDLAETTAQVFLGIRLQCARCHHHPQEVWSQQDYYGMAAFFTRLEKKDTGDDGRFGGVRAMRPIDRIAKDRQLEVPAEPKLLTSSTPAADPKGDIRVVLADWLTDRGNPFFAKNFANRYWFWLMGRGLVEPVDDLRATNPPSHPELLDALARELVEHHFDARHLIRLICRSQVYQRASELQPSRDADGMLLTHRVPRRLSAEVLLDAVNQACGTREKFEGQPPGTRATELPDPAVSSYFLATFGRPLRNSACDCSRGSQPDLAQALHLLNSTTMQNRITDSNGLLQKLMAAQLPADDMMTELYLATLTRPPSDAERAAIHELLAESSSPAECWQDLLWTLLNSSEFVFQH